MSSIPYSTVFRTVKRFFVTQWNHARVQDIVKNMNNYIFEDVDKTSRDVSHNVDDTGEDLSDSLDRVMACLDDDDSSESDDENRIAAPISHSESAAHIPGPAAVVVTPALNLTHTVVTSLSKLIVDQRTSSGSPTAPVPRSPPTDIPVANIVPQHIDIAGESISAASEVLLDNNNTKGRKKGPKKNKTSDAPPRRSSRKA